MTELDSSRDRLPDRVRVAVVGAGPVGLTAGIALAEAGVEFVLLDRQSEGANTSRACVVHARTLEVLDTFGVSEELCELGIVVPRFAVYDGGRRLGSVSFDGLPTPHPYTLLVPQDVTEAVLVNRLRAAGGAVLRQYEVTAVVDEGDKVTLTVTDPDGAQHTLRADYVIGADGMHSSVRDRAGIEFRGDAYASSFVLADIHMDWRLPRAEVAMQLAPQGVTVVAPLPASSDDRYRVVATVADAAERPDRDDVQRILDSRGLPPGSARVKSIVWSSRFRIHHRVADRYRAGRILLAGDAAHVHSPAGGQGMNTGIQDADALARAVIQAVSGTSDTLLNTYESTRRPVALDVVRFTDRMTKAATLRAGLPRLVRNTGVRVATRIPPLRRRIAIRLAELPTGTSR